MGVFKQKEKEVTVNIIVTDVERRIIITALKHLRDEQIKQDKNYDFIETIIGKTAMANSINRKVRNSYEER